MFPGLSLPPRPVITRWGTWIQAAVYSANNFDQIKAFFDRLDADDAQCVAKVNSVLAAPNLKTDLAFIAANFACLPTAITKLEAKGFSIHESIPVFESIRTNLQAISRRKEFLQKFQSVYEKNEGLKTMSRVARVLKGGELNETDEFINALSPAEINALQYAPITSCDVERSFSAYNRVLENCRRSFVFDNLKMHVIIHCNKFD